MLSFSSCKKEEKQDSIKLEIFDGKRLIRTLQFKTPEESGIHKTTWNLDEKGVDRASRSIRNSSREPSGVEVKPGVYKLKMSFGELVQWMVDDACCER